MNDHTPTASALEQPRYLQIFQALRERIGAGDYPIGSLVPTEAELCVEFAVSRYTVREALRRLADLGLVERRQGSGTHVLSAKAGSLFTQSMRSLSELFQYALDTHFAIDRIGAVEIDAAIADTIGGETGSTWLEISGVRWTRAGGQTICQTDVYINARFAWLKDELPATRGPMYALVEQRSGEKIVEAVQDIHAEPMPERVRAALGAPEGTWTLRLVRRYIDIQGETMIASVNHHPADRFTYSMRLKRDALYQS